MVLQFVIPLFGPPAMAQPEPTSSHAARPVYQTQPNTRALPPRYAAPAGPNPTLRLAYWNEVALSANALDHTPAFPGAPVTTAEQPGPTRSSRALAIVHLAFYDALNAIEGSYPGYSGAFAAFADSSRDAAIVQAAHNTLVALYPRQARRLDAVLEADLARLPAARAKFNGIDIGRRTASAILALRANAACTTTNPWSDKSIRSIPRPESGAPIRSAGFRWHWARTGAA